MTGFIKDPSSPVTRAEMEDSEAAARTEGTQDRENICNVAINSVGRGASQCCRIVAGNWNMEHGTILIVPQL